MLNRLGEVFSCLEKRKVKYLVIGGVAASVHGVPRPTYDLDILIEATLTNVKKMLAAFLDAGLGTADMITPEHLLTQEITVFSDRVRIDV